MNTQVRVKAIAVVNSYGLVLSDSEFVDAMRTATRLSFSNNDEDDNDTDIRIVIFGEKMLQELTYRSNKEKWTQEILMDDTAPKAIRKWFVSNQDINLSDWARTKGEMGIVTP